MKLQRLIGSEEEVVETYMQWNELVEADQTATDADLRFNKFWEAVVKESVAAGFKGQALPEGFEGFFEIRVVR